MKRFGWVVWAAAFASAVAARGQWTTQEIPLHEGWNAVCVRVRPAAGSLAELAEQAGEGVLEGVWRWDKRFTSAEYVVDESSPLAKDPHWKAWYAAGDVDFLSTLGDLSPWRSYFVKVADGAGEKTLFLKGKATLPAVAWYPNALNLVGFPVGEAGASFAEWFEADGAVDLSKGYENGVWQVAADGSERVVAKPALQTLAAGEAVWVRCSGASSYAGPLAVSSDGPGEGLDFGADTKKIALSLENLSPTRTRVLTLTLVDSEAAPEGEEQVAGAVPLYLADGDAWTNFSSTTVTLAPSASWKGTFGVHRAAMELRSSLADTNSAYQSVLRVRDAEGKIAFDVPVRAVRETASASDAAESIHAVDASVHAQAGLWVGEAELAEVNCPNYRGDETLPVRHAARLKLVVHVDGEGTARLLKEAWLADGALYSDRAAVPAGATNVWRASSATLPAMPPLVLGTNGLAGTLSGTVALAHDDPVNPFFHRYHPLFDNKNGQFEAYDGAVETREVVRAISLAVAEADADALEDADTAVSGTYEERLDGLRAQTVVVKGTFRLEKAVDVPELSAGDDGEDPGTDDDGENGTEG